MDERAGRPHCLIRFTAAAVADLAGIDNATAVTWGPDQAERYLEFLDGVLADLAQEPTKGKIVEQLPEYRCYLAKLRNRRFSYGHWVFYRQIESGIRVIRILHTAMNWPEHLPGSGAE